MLSAATIRAIMAAPTVDALRDHDYRRVLAAAQAAGLAGEPRAPQTAREAWAASALEQLAYSCDGARTQDGVGFTAGDTGVGRLLGFRVAAGGGLDDAAWRAAIRLCAKYQRTQAGLMPEPDEQDRALDARLVGEAALEAARESARSVSSVLAEARRRAASARIQITLVGDVSTPEGQQTATFLVVAPYSARALDDWRGIRGRRWESGPKANRVPYREARALHALLEAHYRGEDAVGPKGFFVIGGDQ